VQLKILCWLWFHPDYISWQKQLLITMMYSKNDLSKTSNSQLLSFGYMMGFCSLMLILVGIFYPHSWHQIICTWPQTSCQTTTTIFFRDHHFFNVIYYYVKYWYNVLGRYFLAKHKRCPYLKCEHKTKVFMMLCCECLPQTFHRERFWFETLILFYFVMF